MGSLHLSIPAPLNRARKLLSRLARDLEAEPPAGAAETDSITEKVSQDNLLALSLAIIHVTAQ